jgi:arginyl-tRNA--protein-N-Asp/Glu arginylyltransferase
LLLELVRLQKEGGLYLVLGYWVSDVEKKEFRTRGETKKVY